MMPCCVGITCVFDILPWLMRLQLRAEILNLSLNFECGQVGLMFVKMRASVGMHQGPRYT